MEAIRESKKLENWNQVSDLISSPKRKSIILNLSQINEMSKDGESVVVPGKVLSTGDAPKGLKVAAFHFSENARQKIQTAGGKCLSIGDVVKLAPSGQGVRIVQ